MALRDSYQTVCSFPVSEKGIWLRGLLAATGHREFVVSGPWSAEGERSTGPGFHLLLSSSGKAMVLRAEGAEHALEDRALIERLVPAPVASRFAEDLLSERMWAALRRSLQPDWVVLNPPARSTP